MGNGGGFNSRTRKGCDRSSFVNKRRRQSFNSRTRKGATLATWKAAKGSQFQFTHPQGVRRTQRRLCHYQARFNSRTRKGCDSSRLIGNGSCCCFNSRTRKGCDSPELTEKLKGECFNSRTRKGCDLMQCNMLDSYWVSIHAPARGATDLNAASAWPSTVSIHAPAWGATRTDKTAKGLRAVSIHAPAWGATDFNLSVSHFHSVSIHAPAWGATGVERWYIRAKSFQFTHPHGVRPEVFGAL